MPLRDSAASAKDRRHASRLSALQHRHYAAIAGIIRNMNAYDVRGIVAQEFAEALRANPRFDRARFLAACGSANQED